MSRPAVAVALVLGCVVGGWTIVRWSNDAGALGTDRRWPAVLAANRSEPPGISQLALRKRWGSEQGHVYDDVRSRADVGADMAREQSQAMLQRASELGDPYYFLDAFARTTIRAGSFDDKPLDDHDTRWLRRAALVAHCDLGADCDHYPTTVAMCFEQGTCGPLVSKVVQGDDVPREMRTALVRFAGDLANASRDGSLAARFKAPSAAAPAHVQ